MNIGLRRLGFWPLRAVGLDPGRALINAHPSETQKNRDRSEMRRAIFDAIAARRLNSESSVASRDRGRLRGRRS
jgi:hypothetical protein